MLALWTVLLLLLLGPGASLPQADGDGASSVRGDRPQCQFKFRPERPNAVQDVGWIDDSIMTYLVPLGTPAERIYSVLGQEHPNAHPATFKEWVDACALPPKHRGELLFEVDVRLPARPLVAPVVVRIPFHEFDAPTRVARDVVSSYGLRPTAYDSLLETLYGRLHGHVARQCAERSLTAAQCAALSQESCKRHIDPFPGYELPQDNADHLQSDVLRTYRYRYGLRRCVETGTFQGDTTLELATQCSEVITFEVDPGLARAAEERFRREGASNVRLIEGDSGDRLREVGRSDEGTLWFLDGHYSLYGTGTGKEHCPLLRELDAVLDLMDTGDVIIIDDVSALRGERLQLGMSYPELREVQEYLCERMPQHVFDVEHDIARVAFSHGPAIL